jgi:hypothetical protein
MSIGGSWYFTLLLNSAPKWVTLIVAFRGVNSADCHMENDCTADCQSHRKQNVRAECHRPDSSAVYYRTAAVRWQRAAAELAIRSELEHCLSQDNSESVSKPNLVPDPNQVPYPIPEPVVFPDPVPNSGF